MLASMHTDDDPLGNESVISRMRRAVSDDRIRAALMAAIALMCVVSVVWLSYQSWRYFYVPNQLGTQRVSLGGIDLQNRFRETRAWFRGENVYAIYPDAVYPPASYALLGVAFNRLRWQIVKLLWYLASLASVGVLGWQLVRHSLAQTRLERMFLGLMPFAFYATGAALGNGQLVVFVLPLVLNAVLLLTRPSLTTWDTWRGALLMLFALVQPTIAAPFFWLVMFVAPRIKPAVMVVAMYLGLTAFAVPFQIGATIPAKPKPAGKTPAAAKASVSAKASSPAPEPTPAPGEVPPPDASQTDGSVQILNTWSARATHGAYHGSLKGGYASVHDLLAAVGLARWNWPASLAILLALGAWIYRNRQADLWLLLAVTAIVARIWTYHRWYDDLLLLFPLITLFRMTKLPRFSPQTKTLAAGLFFWIWLFLLAPGVLYTVRDPNVLVGIQVTGWIAGLVFLAYQVHRDRQLPSDTEFKTEVA
jgi:hypothetical protein